MDQATITSKRNERIRDAKQLKQKKYRDQHGLFLLEGVRLVEEALATPYTDTVFFTSRLLEAPRGRELLAQADKKKVSTFLCSDEVFSELIETVQSQGVVAVACKPTWPLFCSGLMLVADGVSDPGNMGTLLRTGLAAGCRGLLVMEGSVDLYNPKVLRSSMGAIFHLPHWMLTRDEALTLIQRQQSTLVIADLTDSEVHWDVRYPQNIAVVIGNEAHGVHPRFRDAADLRVQIPLLGSVESLNASVAAGILLYEIQRQHRSEN